MRSENPLTMPLPRRRPGKQWKRPREHDGLIRCRGRHAAVYETLNETEKHRRRHRRRSAASFLFSPRGEKRTGRDQQTSDRHR
ncbi:hypothetical protein X777_00947 [Ooceraea biroi]|uniref:Uncharacterized protein n=1 Tax=Ooceraea biroi TaxID=2015173 RepID=A0A026WP98_OOCBI|nr:hypothetical protein X777_00947 [Ooceraea biroi]